LCGGFAEKNRIGFAVSADECKLLSVWRPVEFVNRLGSEFRDCLTRRHRGGRPRQKPLRVIAVRAYDGDPLRERLAARGIELVPPHRGNRSKPRTQDGRALPRYRRRWKVERTLAWLGSFRRLPIALKIQLNPFASRQIQRILFFWICPIFACFTRSTVTIS
jgi:transposase